MFWPIFFLFVGRGLDIWVKGPLQDAVTWYGINYAGTQVTQWDFQNKGKLGWTGTSSFAFEVPLCNFCPSVINSVPCDRILQRVYFGDLIGGALLIEGRSHPKCSHVPFF